MDRLSHVGSDGRAQMVDVSAKPMSVRTAIAKGRIKLHRKTLDLISNDRIAKGNVFATARLAGIQAAKQTAHLIPLCHTLPLSDVTTTDGVAEAASKGWIELETSTPPINEPIVLEIESGSELDVREILLKPTDG